MATPALPPAYDAAMGRARFAVLDVETTSGDPTQGRVMEVAVLALNGTQERLRWDSLVYPRTPVPSFIRKLTGIDDRMLRDAPTFVEVVRTLETLTQDRILVAHNVRFDMTALAHEFARTGLVFERPTLCTERLSRRLVPACDHFNLGSLCRYFGIPFTAAHRALGDAEATAALLSKLLDAFGEEQVLLGVSSWTRAMRA
ncbi:MAG TPA: 3'-5' exonuclease [Flavobacteriales bacterium]|nr:3'-5' exonuclease [Flavobacteriales bacterium]